MVWIVSLLGAWLGAGLLGVGLVGAAARGDEPTPEHARRLMRAQLYLAPSADD